MEDHTDDPEVIRQRMAENRTALTEKLEALEQQVLGVATTVTDTVESVKDGVQDTVEAVKDTVQETVGTVKETVDETVSTVKDAFNLSRHVERYPWAMLGGSVGVGVLLGLFLPRRRSVPSTAAKAASHFAHGSGGLEAASAAAPAPPVRREPPAGDGARRSEGPGVTDQLMAPVKESLTRIKDLALGTLFGTLQKVLVQELPEAVQEQVKSFVDDTVNRLKGAVTRQEPPAAAEEPPQRGRRRADRQESTFHPETGRPTGYGSW